MAGKPVMDEDTGMVVIDIKSRSRPNVVHQLYCRLQCTCEGYTHRKTCRHVEEALKGLKRLMKESP